MFRLFIGTDCYPKKFFRWNELILWWRLGMKELKLILNAYVRRITRLYVLIYNSKRVACFHFQLVVWEYHYHFKKTQSTTANKYIFSLYLPPFLLVRIISGLGSRPWNWKFQEKHFKDPNPELLLHSSYSFWP